MRDSIFDVLITYFSIKDIIIKYLPKYSKIHFNIKASSRQKLIKLTEHIQFTYYATNNNFAAAPPLSALRHLFFPDFSQMENHKKANL